MRNKKLIPFETIEKAVAGEPEAIDAVLRHYAGRIKYLFLSYPFPNPSPLGQGIAAEPPERKRMEQKRQYKISFAMLRSRTSFLRVVYPCPYRRCNALKSSEKHTLSRNIP